MVKRPLILIFMGVAGTGKTTVATLFARETGAVFYEGDEFHPPENIEKMRQGLPLTDDDREKWLQSLRKIIVRSIAENAFVAITCSALKAKYRTLLQGGDGCIRFVYLTGSPTLIEERLRNRHGHFMPASLLASQLATLEPPTEALTFDCSKPPAEIVSELIQVFGIARKA